MADSPDQNKDAKGISEAYGLTFFWGVLTGAGAGITFSQANGNETVLRTAYVGFGLTALFVILGVGIMKRSMACLIGTTVIFALQLALLALFIVQVKGAGGAPGPLLYGQAGICLLLLIGVSRHIPALGRLNASPKN